MTLMELFQSDARWRGILTKIMVRRSRLRYKKLDVEHTLHASTSAVDSVSMAEIRELHYLLHPEDARKVKKPNLTPRRKL